MSWRNSWIPGVNRVLRPEARRLRGAVTRRLYPDPWKGMRRLQPVDSRFGMGRGTPVDRVYIERFLEAHKPLIRGHVLEVGDDRYTSKFGGSAGTRRSVLDLSPRSGVSIVGDLTKGIQGYEQAFDCLLLTQVLPFLFDVEDAVATVQRVCKAGGAALVTFPGISQISRYDMDRSGDFWRFSDASAKRLFARAFGDDNVRVHTYGNLLTATALLHGIAAEELAAEETDHRDPDYPVIIGVVARARSSSSTAHSGASDVGVDRLPL